MVPASPTNPYHQVNRLVVVADLARALLAEHATADAALSHACTLSDAGWLTLARSLGHYSRPGEAPALGTIGDVLSTLEAMVPSAKVIADPFVGIPA